MDEDKKSKITKEKQNYLRFEILEQNYDADEFSEWMETLKKDGKKN